MSHLHGFVMDMRRSGRLIYGYFDHGELVIQLVASDESAGYLRLVVAVVLKDSLMDAQVSHRSISQKPSQKGAGSRIQI